MIKFWFNYYKPAIIKFYYGKKLTGIDLIFLYCIIVSDYDCIEKNNLARIK